MLLGLVLFLRLHRSSPFLAGVSLWLCLLKPHLFVPFGIVLIVWAIVTRSYSSFWELRSLSGLVRRSPLFWILWYGCITGK